MRHTCPTAPPAPAGSIAVVGLLLGLLAGCGGAAPEDKAGEGPGIPDGGGGPDTAEPEPDWSHLVEDDVHAPTLTAAEVGAEIERAFARGYPRPQDVVADYLRMLTFADDTCPAAATFNYGFVDLEGCTTAEGYLFQGAAGLLIEDERVYADTGFWSGTYYIQTQPADYAIYRPDGTSLQAGGIFSLKMQADGTSLAYWCHMTGTYEDGASETWLREGFSGNLDTQGVREGTDYRQTIDGFVSIGDVSLELDAVEIDTRSSATAPMSGRVSLRQADSTWYDLELDPDGSGCGTLTWDDREDLGPLCVDLAVLVEVTSTMWVI